MPDFIVTVHYALRITAKNEDEAQRIVENMYPPENYVEDSFQIPDIHPATDREEKWISRPGNRTW